MADSYCTIFFYIENLSQMCHHILELSRVYLLFKIFLYYGLQTKIQYYKTTLNFKTELNTRLEMSIVL